MPGVGSGAAVFDGAGSRLQQCWVFQQGEMRREDILFLDALTLAGMLQCRADFAAHLLQRCVQALQLFVGGMVAGVGRQFDTGQVKQRPVDQSRRSTHTLQHTGFTVCPAWSDDGRGVVFFFNDDG